MAELRVLLAWGLITLSIGVLILGTYFLIRLLRKRRQYSVLMNIIGNDGVIKKKRIRDPPKRFKVNKKSYVYDQECELKDKWHKQLYYWENNPNPIRFDRPKQELQLNSANLTKVVENNFIQQLFSTDDLITATNLLLFAAVGGVALILYLMLVDPPAVTLIASDVNNQLIMDACRAAFVGS